MLRRFPILLVLIAPLAYGQGVMQPLTIQGLERQESATVRARGMGTVSAAQPGSAESVLLNPAGLASLPRPALSASGLWLSRDWAETQHWNPNRYYAGLSLFFSDPEDYRSEPLSEPDWTHKQDAFRLATVGGAIPVSLAGKSIGLGVMLHHVAQLDDFDRNDNVLDPYIGQFRPDPIERPKPGEEITVRWSAFERQRTGHLRAISTAVGFELVGSLHVGVRISRSWGSSTDRQHVRDIGVFSLREDAHDYSHEVVSGHRTWEGSSDFGGWSGALGIRWQYQVLTAGIIYQLRTTITQTYDRNIDLQASDSGEMGLILAGEDEITLPARIVAGIALRPASSIVLAADYFWQDYEALDISSTGRTAIPDWGRTRGVGLGLEWQVHSGSFVRAGFRRDPQPFRIEGFGLLGQTATGDAFSAGLGTSIFAVTLDIAYEFQRLRYQDRWESNVDYNRIRKHNVLFGVTYLL